ncbi:TPA: DEAD/DEAH box helicase [Candidatus Woesearchaeota archaeon]|nr:DEAD/DEAH box helicase [Candidatus Woesearchaeota archaeon]
MNLAKHKSKIPEKVYDLLERRGFTELRPCQIKSIDAGLFEDKNLLVCTPTASGKTLVGELAALNGILHDRGKAVYIVPLRALASEKFRQFRKDYPNLKVAMSTGDLDEVEGNLGHSDVIIVTSEKFDSLLRHRVEWLKRVKTVVVDEIHLLNDPSRGPTLEIVLTILKRVLPHAQIVGLSATIGNKEDLAAWLNAELVEDSWRPVKLEKGVYLNGKIEFV